MGVVCQHARDLPEHGGLADSGLAQQQDALARHDEVFNDADGAVHGASDPQGQADGDSRAVANGGDSVKSALDTGTVVLAELADALDGVLDVFGRDLSGVERDALIPEARLRHSSEVKDYFEEVVEVISVAKRRLDVGRKLVDQDFQIAVCS